MIIRCDKCKQEAIVRIVEYPPGQKRFEGLGPITVWLYSDGFGHILYERTRLDYSKNSGEIVCPECRDRANYGVPSDKE